MRLFYARHLAASPTIMFSESFSSNMLSKLGFLRVGEKQCQRCNSLIFFNGKNPKRWLWIYFNNLEIIGAHLIL